MSWDDDRPNRSRKHTIIDVAIVVIVTIILIALMLILQGRAKAGDVPPFPTMSSTAWVATSTAVPVAPYHANVYLPLIVGGE